MEKIRFQNGVDDGDKLLSFLGKVRSPLMLCMLDIVKYVVQILSVFVEIQQDQHLLFTYELLVVFSFH